MHDPKIQLPPFLSLGMKQSENPTPQKQWLFLTAKKRRKVSYMYMFPTDLGCVGRHAAAKMADTHHWGYIPERAVVAEGTDPGALLTSLG